MDVGVQALFAKHGRSHISDGQLYREEMELALLGEELGFDCIWAVEHHCYDYSLCPDNTVWLAAVAAATERIDVGTGAIIMPWNDPLRVAEKVAILDHVAGGRFRLGFGRGLSQREYSHFTGIDMSESRDRFDEGTMMVKEALETGFIEGEGPYYPQARTPIRPTPERTFEGRTYAVASSEDSLLAAAQLRAAMVCFANRPWEQRLPQLNKWREHYRRLHSAEPPPPLICDFVYCHDDPGIGSENGERYLATYLESVFEHYDLLGEHFEGMEAYAGYAKRAQVLRRTGTKGHLDGLLAATAYGTPDQILESYRARWDLIGPFEANPSFSFGGIPIEEAKASMRLFAKEVLPELHRWN